jgi:hypothetical protein
MLTVVHNKIEHEKHLLRTVVLIGGYTRNRMHNPTIKIFLAGDKN